jgi:Trk K+ transport system NAD-binding subunit
MKYLSAQLAYLVQDRRVRRNMESLVKFLLFLVLCIVAYSVVFHVLMEREGQHHSWVTGFYWTLTVMTTLGFGDITFASDLGRLFSILVLLSGIIFLLVMLPFTFIQFFYAPFLEAQARSRVPRELPEESRNHVIILGADPVALGLASRLRQYGFESFLVTPEVSLAQDLLDQGFRMVVGDYDDPETYIRLRAARAAMVVALCDDMINTNSAFTVREVAPDTAVVANAEMPESVDILQLAGASRVFEFMKMLGEMLARRTLGTSASANVIGRFDEMFIVEAPAMRTPLAGRTVRDCGLRQATGMNIVGMWERGDIKAPQPDQVIGDDAVLLLAGSETQLAAYDRFVGKVTQRIRPVLILGGGRVGRAAASVLADRDLPFCIVEKNPKLFEEGAGFILGNASDLDTLNRAGIREAPSVLITTHNDDLNIYLTIYCRRLRPDIQIISRATLDRNITVLHKAGADLVMSHATLAANTVINLLLPGKVLMLTEGLNIFKVQVHPDLAGRPLAGSGIREKTGCSLVAVRTGRGLDMNPGPDVPLEAGAELILVGTAEAERRFMEMFPG